MHKKLIALLLLVFMIMPVWAYEPLTYAEADNYLDSVTYDRVIEIVIDYDYLEHTVPEVTFPRGDFILIDQDLIVTYQSLKINHSNFAYELDVPRQIVYDFVEPPKSHTFQYISYFVLGTALGVLIGVIVG